VLRVHEIPSVWIAESGLQKFKPSRSAFRCDLPHILIALSEIEMPMRLPHATLDANGFSRERMMRILAGIRNDDAMPPIEVEKADPGQRPYRLRAGFHRFYASFTVGFSHVPAEIVERLD
jgi:hypothetical protein